MLMNYNLVVLLLVSFGAQVTFGQQAGTLKARFVYGGEAVSPKPIEVKLDKARCGSQSLVDERVMINVDDKGLRHVIFHLYTGRGGYRLPLEKRQPVSKTLKAEICRFEPHVMVLQAGDTLEIREQDVVGHAVLPIFFANKVGGGLRPPRATLSFLLTEPEPAIVPVECAIHPWMRAYIAVLDHPLVDVSDAHGNIEIEGLLAGAPRAVSIVS